MNRRDGGFTIVELMVVVLIIGVLVSIAVPVVASSRTRAAASSCLASRTVVERAAAQYRTTEGVGAPDLQAFVSSGLIKSLPKCPSGGVYVWHSGGADATADSLLCSVHFAGSSQPLWASDWSNASLRRILSGGWTLVNGQLVPALSGGQMLFTTPSPADFRLEADATLSSGSGYGIYFRSTAGANGRLSGYAFQFDPGLGNKFVVRKVVNGVESGLIAVSSMPAGFPIYGSAHHTTITTIGTHTVIKVDGVPVLDFVDATFGSGQAGLRSWGSSKVGVSGVSVYGATAP